MYRNDSKLNYIGNGKLDAIQIARAQFGDAYGASINLASDLGSMPGEDPKKQIKKQTFQIDNDGGTSELRLILKRYMVDQTGAALASGTVVSINGTNYTCGASGVITHNIDGVTYTTLHDFIDQINTFAGFKATILHALTTQDTGNNDYIDVAETVLADVSAGGTNTLYRAASELFMAVIRIGLPIPNGRDPLQLLQVKGTATGVTTGTVKLIRDDFSEYVAGGTHQETYLEDTLVSATMTEYLGNNVLEGATIRGPVVLEVKSTDLSAADIKVHYRQALVNM